MIGRLIPGLVLVLALATGGQSQAGTRPEGFQQTAITGGQPRGVGRPGRLPAVAIVRSMLLSPRLIDYEGTKIISTMRGGGMETVTVLEAHKRPNRTRLEFLSPEPVAGRLIVDNGVEAWHYEPSLHMAFQGPSLAPRGEPTAAMAGLIAAYRLEVLGTEEVIGRPTFVLSLVPRGGRGGHRFWVDQATGLPLRVEERGAQGLVYVVYFTRISFSLNLPEALFRLRAPAGARIFSLFPGEEEGMTLAAVEQAVGFPVRTPATPPAGLRLDRITVARYGPVAAAHLRYTDGATPVSVFQVAARRVVVPAGGTVLVRGRRALRVLELGYFKVVTWQEERLRLTIVGAQPLAVLLRMADQFGGR
jgi:outer membrane lipoprotein-sorting protein